MASGIGEKEINSKWPVVSGIEAVDKHEGRKMHLEPTEADLTPEAERVGL